MENKLFTLFFFPEFLLAFGSLILLLVGLFIKHEAFKKISLLSIILLFIVGISVLIDTNLSFAFYDTLFKSSKFILFFKVLIIVGSIASISISINYFDIKQQSMDFNFK